MTPEAHIARQEAQIAELRAQNAWLSQQLAELRRLVFGARSERFVPGAGPDQVGLFGGDGAVSPNQAAPPEEVVRRKPRRKPSRQVLPAHLPREVIVIEPDRDTAGLRKIGAEVTESLDYRPAKLVVIRRERRL